MRREGALCLALSGSNLCPFVPFPFLVALFRLIVQVPSTVRVRLGGRWATAPPLCPVSPDSANTITVHVREGHGPAAADSFFNFLSMPSFGPFNRLTPLSLCSVWPDSANTIYSAYEGGEWP